MKKSRKNIFLIIIVVIILLIFFHSLGFLVVFENYLVKLITPLQAKFYQWGLGFTSFANYRSLVEENSRLREEITKLNIDFIKLASLEAENEYLKKELDFLREKDYHYKLAKVIGHLPFNEQVLIINQGADANLKAGFAATVNQGVIVGKLIKIEKDRSFVELLTNTKSQLAVTLSHLTGTNGLLKGRAGNSLLIDLIPFNKEVQVDDLVITSGLEEVPRGLLVGKINQVESVAGQIFKQARVTPSLNYQNLQILTIIKSF